MKIQVKSLLGVVIIALFASIYLWYFNLSFKKENTNNEITINVKNINYELEDYIIGVIACEMPAAYYEEALKAQAVAARTYAMQQYSKNPNYQFSGDTKDQCYNTIEEMQAKWGNEYQKYYNKIKNAVNTTEGEVMNKNNQMFKSYYFSTTNGYTENSLTVFNEVGLNSVESLWDKESKDYKKTISITYNELKSKLGDFKNIKIVSRNSTNHVSEVLVDSKKYTGIEFRKLLGLRSTDFYIEKNNDSYEITTYGYGHGVGMSQYGANYLAKNNYKYQDILKYYYGNVEFVKI